LVLVAPTHNTGGGRISWWQELGDELARFEYAVVDGNPVQKSELMAQWCAMEG
jgi:hypothetical protein